VTTTGDTFRYERKFLVKSHSHRVVEAVVRKHSALFHTAYPDREVNNIYFDSADYQSLRDNIEGVRNRTKTRIRWYGDPRGQSSRSNLELKIKRGLVGTKASYSLASLDTTDGRIRARVRDQMRRSSLPDRISLHMSMIMPSLLNSYWRQYFVSGDGRFRITIDRDMRFYRPHNPWTRPPDVQRGASVIELKYARADNPAAAAIAQELGFRLTRNSKYVTGMSLLHGVADYY
jgi:VTC domain